MLSMPAPLRLRVGQGTREALAERYQQARSAIERNNCWTVLRADNHRDFLAGAARTRAVRYTRVPSCRGAEGTAAGIRLGEGM